MRRDRDSLLERRKRRIDESSILPALVVVASLAGKNIRDYYDEIIIAWPIFRSKRDTEII